MATCVHNDIVGLKNRYLKTSTHDFTANITSVNRILDELCHKLRPNFSGPISLEEFVSSKKGKLATRYKSSVNEILTGRFDVEKSSRIKAFIKNELYDELKPPRMIMGRDPAFNCQYGRFTTPLEHAMQCLEEVSKGRNFFDRGEQFKEKIFGRWAYECDFSKYEATQRARLLVLIELGIWKRLLSDGDYRIVEKLFITKMLKKGVTLSGTKFNFEWCRGSGDMDTGLFNTLITWVACRYFEDANNLTPGNFIADGDDNVIAVPIGKTCKNTFSEFGLDAKLILRKDYHDIDYCSGKFLQYEPSKFIYVQNVKKIMQNLRVFRKTKFSHCIGAYYYSLGYMYKIMYNNMPIYTDIADFLMSFTLNHKHVHYDILEELNPEVASAFKASKRVNIDFDTPNVRTELAMAFDFTMAEIRHYSEWYQRAEFRLASSEDKRYNAPKTPRLLLSAHECHTAERLLDQAFQNAKFSKAFNNIEATVQCEKIFSGIT